MHVHGNWITGAVLQPSPACCKLFSLSSLVEYQYIQHPFSEHLKGLCLEFAGTPGRQAGTLESTPPPPPYTALSNTAALRVYERNRKKSTRKFLSPHKEHRPFPASRLTSLRSVSGCSPSLTRATRASDAGLAGKRGMQTLAGQ